MMFDPEETADFIPRRASGPRLRAMARQIARLRADDEAAFDDLMDLEYAVDRLPDADREAVRALLREEVARAMGGVTR